MGHVRKEGKGDEVTHRAPDSFTTNSHSSRKKINETANEIRHKS